MRSKCVVNNYSDPRHGQCDFLYALCIDLS